MSKWKLACLLVPLFSTFYILLPFINGLGCNFSFQEKGQHINQIGKCKAGVLTTFYKESGYGNSSYNRYIYGVLGGTFYLIRINKERVEQKNTFHSSISSNEDYDHAFSLYDGDRLYVSRYICVNERRCFVITDDAIENIYEMIFDGRLGFFSG